MIVIPVPTSTLLEMFLEGGASPGFAVVVDASLQVLLLVLMCGVTADQHSHHHG